MRHIAIGSLALLLAACGSSESGSFETEDGSGEYTIDNDGDGVEMSFTDDQGNETTINSGSDVEVDLPNGFTVYPGAEVVHSTVVDGAEGIGRLVVMSSSDGPSEMVSFYRDRAEASGFAIETTVSSGDMQMIGGEGPDEQFFGFTANAEGDATTGMLTIGTRPQ